MIKQNKDCAEENASMYKNTPLPEGIYCVGVKGKDVEISMKMESGSMAVLAPAVIRVLDELDVLTKDELKTLEKYNPMKNTNDLKILYYDNKIQSFQKYGWVFLHFTPRTGAIEIQIFAIHSYIELRLLRIDCYRFIHFGNYNFNIR